MLPEHTQGVRSAPTPTATSLPPSPHLLPTVSHLRPTFLPPSSHPRRAQARAKELKNELINSKRLATFFEEHPGDLQLLRHDQPLAADGAGAAAPHLKHFPGYLRGAGGVGGVSHTGNRGEGGGGGGGWG
jgi:hypothetical protein